MLISFILIAEGNSEQLSKTLISIESQTIQDYELIITLDDTKSKKDEETLMKYFLNNKNTKVIFNSTYQGSAVCWNSAIDLAEGTYSQFIKEGDIIAKTYIEEVQKCVNKNGEVDLIEYSMNLQGIVDTKTKTFLEKNKVFNLKKDQLPFAYVNGLIFNKLFKSKKMSEFVFKFRRFVRYDMLFIFKYLAQSNTYVFMDCKELMDCTLLKVKYSLFDFVNQWPHILNYYRRIGRFKELKDYLNYAFYKEMLHLWLWSIQKYDNKLLLKKAVAHAERKFHDKREDFMNNNKVFLLKKDETFTSIVLDFDKYIKGLLKTTR